MGRPRIDASGDSLILADKQDRDLCLKLTVGGEVCTTNPLMELPGHRGHAPRVIAARMLGRPLKETERAIHRNRVHTDVRRCNLAVVSSGEWRRMNEKKPGKTSRYKGVSWVKKVQKWRAGIQLPSENGQRGKGKFLGNYSTEEEAALAYDDAVKELGLPHAFLNF